MTDEAAVKENNGEASVYLANRGMAIVPERFAWHCNSCHKFKLANINLVRAIDGNYWLVTIRGAKLNIRFRLTRESQIRCPMCKSDNSGATIIEQFGLLNVLETL